MALAEFLAELDDLAREAPAALAAAGDAEAVEAARIQFLGAKSGRLKAVQKGLGGVDKADKPAAGKRFNDVKQQIEAALEEARQRLAAGQTATATAGVFDPTVPGMRPRLGHLHPITQTIEELKDIMGRLGFTVADGPEVEDDWHNFEALNIPPDHPARDPLDNFYLATAAAPPADADAACDVRAAGLAVAEPDEHGANPRDGNDPAAGADHFAGPRVSARHGRRHPLPHVPPDRGPAGRSPGDDGRLEEHLAAVRRGASSRTTSTFASAPRSSPSPSRASRST